MAKVKKQKKISPSKKTLIDNYANQIQYYTEHGYTEQNEVISVLKANVMAFVTAGPFVILGIIFWLFLRSNAAATVYGYNVILFLTLFFASIFIHEVLHGIGWSLWTKRKWKSIYLGVMWEFLTPYCHCKEPLKPRQYLFGVLTPFVVLGIGSYIIACITGSHLLFILSLLNIFCAGGDTTIACMELKYLKQNEVCYILDHPTDCGFVAFVKTESINRK